MTDYKSKLSGVLAVLLEKTFGSEKYRQQLADEEIDINKMHPPAQKPKK